MPPLALYVEAASWERRRLDGTRSAEFIPRVQNFEIKG
jgi:hypothetical protein